MKHLYMAVTRDKYELPVFVASRCKEIAVWAGVTESGMNKAIHNKNYGRNKGIKYIKVTIEEEN